MAAAAVPLRVTMLLFKKERTARFMLPQMMVSLGPSVARRGITQRPVLLLWYMLHSSDMSLLYSFSVLSLPVVSIVLLPASKGQTSSLCHAMRTAHSLYYGGTLHSSNMSFELSYSCSVLSLPAVRTLLLPASSR